MRYYEIHDETYILGFGIGGHGGEEISEERYNDILNAMSLMPKDTETISHRLKRDLTYEEINVEPVQDEPTAEELLNILTGEAE